MKKNIFVILLPVLLFGCTEEQRPEIVMNSVPPAPVTDVQVQNIPGGAILKYQLPDDEDLLYVKALYSLKEGHQAEVRASLYCDTLTIKGFGDEQEREVQLVAVDRSKNESEPVKVTVKPLEPPVLAIGKTLSMFADFGGVGLSWENPTRAEISVILERKDSIGDYEQVDIFYSSVVEGDGTARGMDTVNSDFRAYVQDRWENRSDPLDANLTPLFETKFDRTKFKALYLDGDEPYAWGWVLPNMFDGNTGTGFHTETTNNTWPQLCSFDMGVKGKISRIKIFQRSQSHPSGTYLYNFNNVRRFEVWGNNDVNTLNDWSTWIKLMDCESIKPSGLPVGEVSDEDRAYAVAGEEYICPGNAPAVRYLRLRILETWGLIRAFYIMEIEVYGSIEEE